MPEHTFDTRVPEKLKRTQQWFGKIVATPLVDLNYTQEVTRAGNNIQEDAKAYISPSPTLEPHQRIEIYNQQYWWRLLSTLHESYPLVVRLMGYYAFNQKIGIPYLDACPPKHWSLSKLGDRMYGWVEKHWDEEEEKELILNAISLDNDFSFGFTSSEGASLNSQSVDSLERNVLQLQPYVRLFSWPYNLLSFRKEVLMEEPGNPLPELEKSKEEQHFVLYRNKDSEMAWVQVSKEEQILLKRFKHPSSIEEVCGWLEQQDEDLVVQCAPHLQEWFGRWAYFNLLSS